jgi:hypothetical protein
MNPIGIALLAVGIYFLMKKNSSSGGSGYSSGSSSTASKRTALVQWVYTGGDSQETKLRAVNLFQTVMSDSEINSVYQWVFNKVDDGAIEAISNKYDIFT